MKNLQPGTSVGRMLGTQAKTVRGYSHKNASREKKARVRDGESSTQEDCVASWVKLCLDSAVPETDAF